MYGALQKNDKRQVTEKHFTDILDLIPEDIEKFPKDIQPLKDKIEALVQKIDFNKVPKEVTMFYNMGGDDLTPGNKEYNLIKSLQDVIDNLARYSNPNYDIIEDLVNQSGN